MRRPTPTRSVANFVAIALFCSLSAQSNTAQAVDGTELNVSTGVWAPLLPTFQVGPNSDDGDSVGGIVGLSGIHRFEGYRTNAEGSVRYGFTDSAEMFSVDAGLRDTWAFEIGDLSAGAGFSLMDWQQDLGPHTLDSQYVGGKIVGGWETAFGRRPIWIDLNLGLYDLTGEYTGAAGPVVVTDSVNKFTTTYGVDVKSDFSFMGVPSRVFAGINFIDDIATWENGKIGTDNALVLQGGIEFLLY